MKTWIVFAFLSMFFAGFTSVIAKMGLNGISGELGLAIRTCFVFLFVMIFAVARISSSQLQSLGWNNYLWLGISGVTTTLSWIFYYLALKDGKVSTIALIDKGSVVVAILLAAIILKEQITLRTIGGGLLMIAGLLLIAKK